MSHPQFERPDPRVLAAVRAQAFAALTPRTSASTHLGIVAHVYPEGHVLRLVDQEIVVPADSVVVFEDQLPGANFGHPCRYHFHSAVDGNRIHVVDAQFPPEVADAHVQVDYFHAPLATDSVRPTVFEPAQWDYLPHYRWLFDDNRYALLFTSQISNRRHVEDLELAWRTLHHRFGFPATNIYVLCYDGTIGATDATAAQMTTWIGDNSPYQMQVHASATKANLQSTLAAISTRMNSESLLFVHTNNHGSPSGLCIDNSSVLTPTEWASMLDGMNAFGTLVVTMEQCYSGAFLDPTLNHSKAGRTSFASAVPSDKVSAGATHFDPWAQAWFEAVNGATAYGGGLGHQPDTNSDGRVSVREAFAYSSSYDTASIDDPQYGDSPQGCGSAIFLTPAPSLWDILREIITRYQLIEQQIDKHPIPDPPPDWSTELLVTLSSAVELQHRLQRVADRRVETVA